MAADGSSDVKWNVRMFNLPPLYYYSYRLTQPRQIISMRTNTVTSIYTVQDPGSSSISTHTQEFVLKLRLQKY